MASEIDATIEAIRAVPDDAEGITYYADAVTKDVDGNLEAETLCSVEDLKALVSEIERLRALVEGYRNAIGDFLPYVRAYELAVMRRGLQEPDTQKDADAYRNAELQFLDARGQLAQMVAERGTEREGR